MRAAITAGLLVVASLGLVTGSAGAGSETTTNSCQNSATGTFTDIDITVSGTATGDASSVVLGGAQLSAFFPAAVLVAGYNLGLLTPGVNDIPGTLSAVIDASNTSEATQTLADVALTGQTTITDPDGTPGNGDETATDLSVTVPLPDTTWTPAGGDVAFSSNGSTIEASLLGGVIKVNFNCSIGTSTPAGCVADPATDCTGFTAATAGPFETFTAGTTDTTTTEGATTTTTEGATTTTTEGATTTTTEGATTTTAAPTTTTTAAPSGDGNYGSECTNSATPDTSELNWKVAGTAPASAAVGDSVVLSDQQWQVTVPASVFATGINLNLLSPGQDVSALVDATVVGTNTVEGSATADDIALSLVVEVDDSGAAVDVTTGFTVPDMTFTASGGSIGFAPSTLVMSVDIGLPIDIDFSCTITAGQGDFATVNVGGGSATTTTTTVATVGAGQQDLADTGAGSTLVLAAAGLMLVDLGYLAFTTSRPGRRRREI